jgi:hypothetical protein
MNKIEHYPELVELWNEYVTTRDKLDKEKGFTKEYRRLDKETERIYTALDAKGKELNTLCGRTIREPHADSYAFYVVIKEYKNQVQINCFDMGDGWSLPCWGNDAKIPKQYLLDSINSREALAKLFS